MRFVSNNQWLHVIYHTVISYGAPVNLSYMWNFGSLAIFCLVTQIISGIFLAMHYTPNIDMAFLSVEHIMRDVRYGWLIRYIHSNGASMFFLVVYLHIFRGLYYGSYVYPRRSLWVVGVIIFLLMILTAFLGYVLPWGQMSFWAATVITNLASAIPKIGTDIVIWLWGAYAVDNSTLNRFFSLHYLLPFIITALVFLHILLLHENGSNNPLGIAKNITFVKVSTKNKYLDSAAFGPYYTIKDLYGVIIFLWVFFAFIFFAPNLAGHPDNYIPANPLVTPAHIVPEWYFLPFYAMLRSIPNKLGGVIILLSSIIILVIFPFYLNNTVRSNRFKPLHKFYFWLFFMNYLVLGKIGGEAIETPFYEIGQLATIFYFMYFIIILPYLQWYENKYLFEINNFFFLDNYNFTDQTIKVLEKIRKYTASLKPWASYYPAKQPKSFIKFFNFKPVYFNSKIKIVWLNTYNSSLYGLSFSAFNKVSKVIRSFSIDKYISYYILNLQDTRVFLKGFFYQTAKNSKFKTKLN